MGGKFTINFYIGPDKGAFEVTLTWNENGVSLPPTSLLHGVRIKKEETDTDIIYKLVSAAMACCDEHQAFVRGVNHVCIQSCNLVCSHK